MKMTTRFLASGIVLAAIALVLSCAKPTPAPTTPPKTPAAPAPAAAPAKPTPAPSIAPPKEVTVALPWGPSAGTATAQGVVFAKLLKDHSTWLRGSPVLVPGFAMGVEFWQKGKDQGVWALTLNQGLMVEYTQGIKTYKEQGPRKDQGLLWPSFLQDFCWLSRAGSAFRTMADFKGAKLALSEPGTVTLLAQKYMLEYGLGLKDGDYKAIYAGFNDIISMFKEGTAQVIGLPHIGARGVPYPYVDEATSSVNAQFVPVTQDVVDKINKALGGDLYFVRTLPAGVYRNQTTDTTMLSNVNFITLPTMYSAEIGYELTRVWWDYHDEGVEMNSRVGLGEPRLTQDALKRKWAFDWHPGALKYYKEKGWI